MNVDPVLVGQVLEVGVTLGALVWALKRIDQNAVMIKEIIEKCIDALSHD